MPFLSLLTRWPPCALSHGYGRSPLLVFWKRHGGRGGAAGPQEREGILPDSPAQLCSMGQVACTQAPFVACSHATLAFPRRQIRAFPEMTAISHTTCRAAPGPSQGKGKKKKQNPHRSSIL